MPIIINEFEAVAEPPVRSSSAEPEAEEPRKEPTIEPQDVQPALAMLAQRALRCWAH